MDIKVYHLLPGSGPEKARLLSRTASEMRESRDYGQMLCLFPTRLYQKYWHRKVFHPEAGECYIPPETFTLGQYATSSAQNTGVSILDPALRPSIISSLSGHGTGFSSLVSGFIKEMKQQFPGIAPSDIRPLLLEEFENCNIPADVAAHALRAMDAYETYEAAITAKGYIDQEDAYSRAASYIAQDSALNYTTLVIEGFYELSPAELLLVRSLLSRIPKSLILAPISAQGDIQYCFTRQICDELGLKAVEVLPSMPPVEPMLYPAASLDRELEAMARHIKQRHLSGAMRELEDVLIVFPDLRAYGSSLKRIFRRYGVPVNEGSIIPPTYKQGPWGDLMSMVRSITEGYPRLEFSRFLTSPYFRKIPSDIRGKAPLAALDSGMVKGRSSWLRALGSDSARWIFSTLEPLHNIRESSTFEAYIHLLRTILGELLFYPDENGPASAAVVLEKLRPCGDITQKEVSLSEFADALEALIWSKDRPDETPGVEAASIFDVRGLEPEVLYIGGLKDGDIPSRPDMDLLLPDVVRRRLGLVNVDRYMDLQEKIFTRLRMSARDLYLSYPEMEEDKVFLPSVFLSGVKASPYPVSGHYSYEEELTSWGGDSLAPRLREIILPGAYGSERVLGVTEIDSYRRCPRRFAIERVLALKPTDITEYELEPTELGSIVHRIMENLITGYPGTIEEFRAKAIDAIESALAEAGHDRFFSDLTRESFLSALPDIHELETKISQEYKVKHKEKAINAEPLKGIRLKGKADRIDISSDGKASVIDYKTGAATISGQALDSRGENLQIFLYAAMLRDEGIETERVGIYSLKDIKVKWVPGKRDLKNEMHMAHFIDSALSYLAPTVKEMRQGLFPARPISASICNSCHEVPFCPYFQSSIEKLDGNLLHGGDDSV